MIKQISILLLIVLVSLSACTKSKANPPIFINKPEDAFALSEDLHLNILLIFTADWCINCKIMKNDIDHDLETYNNTIICYVDYNLYKQMSINYKVKLLPDSRIYKDKIEIKQKQGYKNYQDFLQWYREK